MITGAVGLIVFGEEGAYVVCIKDGAVGLIDGLIVGDEEFIVGLIVGEEGLTVGFLVGKVGTTVGEKVGSIVGILVAKEQQVYVVGFGVKVPHTG